VPEVSEAGSALGESRGASGLLSSGEKIRSSYFLRSLVYCSAEPADVSFLVMDWPQRHWQAEIL
jgi:hypothetical protein